MPDVTTVKPKGALRTGWSGAVGDYAIAGGWALGGELLVVGDAAGGISAFAGTSGKTQWERRDTHGGGVLAMAIQPGGEVFATAGQDGRALIWNAADGEVTSTLELGSGWVEHLAWSADGQRLAASISRRVHVFGVDGRQQWRSDDHPSTVSAIAWSGPQELATACYGRVVFSDVPSGKPRQQLEWKGSLISMVLSPDGDIVACGSQDNTVHFWRRSSGEDSMMSGYRGKPAVLAFDDSGSLLATSGGEAATVWCFEGAGPEGTRPGVLELHVQPITSLTFAPRGRRLASAARDGTVAVWALRADGQGEPEGAAVVQDAVDSLQWRPDGRALAALDAQGGVTVWRVNTGL